MLCIFYCNKEVQKNKIKSCLYFFKCSHSPGVVEESFTPLVSLMAFPHLYLGPAVAHCLFLSIQEMSVLGEAHRLLALLRGT